MMSPLAPPGKKNYGGICSGDGGTDAIVIALLAPYLRPDGINCLLLAPRPYHCDDGRVRRVLLRADTVVAATETEATKPAKRRKRDNK